MKSNVLFLFVSLLALSLPAKAIEGCFDYSWMALKEDGSATCDSSELSHEKIVGSICVQTLSETLLRDSPVSVGKYKIALFDKSGEPVVSSIYQAHLTDSTDEESSDDYRPAQEAFKYRNYSGLVFYKFTRKYGVLRSGSLSIGDRQACFSQK